MMLYSPSIRGFLDTDINSADTLPGDAVEISAEEHAALLRGQAAGKQIVAGQDGRPVLADQPPPTLAQLAADALALRTQRLTATDWIALRSLEKGATVPADWAAYRQALRDLPDQAGFPTSITWPTAPAT